jgi:hypothetical protein
MKTEQAPLALAADNVIANCLGVKNGEVVTVLTDTADEQRMKIGRSLWEAAQKRGAEAIYVEMLPRKNSGEEPPVSIAALNGDERRRSMSDHEATDSYQSTSKCL